LKGLDLKNDDRQNKEIPGVDPITILNNDYFNPLKKEIETTHEFSIDNSIQTINK
jgi:hypothetical protein